MASTIHNDPHDCVAHAERIYAKTGDPTTVFFSVPSNLFACLPTGIAHRMYAANPQAIYLVATIDDRGTIWEGEFAL